MYPAVRNQKDSCEYPEGKPLSRGGIQEAVERFNSSILDGYHCGFFSTCFCTFRGCFGVVFIAESNLALSMLVATIISSEGVEGGLSITMSTHLEQQ
jgi:hypothetical protein